MRALALRIGGSATVGVLCGLASALFLWLLDEATHFREANRAVVLALPIAGLAIGWLYDRHGRQVLPGNNLVIDTIHDGGPQIPLRMAPMVLIGTVMTHLFGGSAGREGTAVQMGAGLADWFSHRCGASGDSRRDLLVAGVAGGFGSVFGTPIAGAVFALEFVVRGRLSLRGLVPALVASVVGDLVTRGVGVVHTPYPSVAPVAMSWSLAGRWLVFAAAVALVAVLFIRLTHFVKVHSARHLRSLSMRMFAGGVCVLLLWQVSGTTDYLGLSIPTMIRAFEDPALPEHVFALKLLFTAITLGAGFLGGEVTPLFVAGAALGNALAGVLDLPLALAAGAGMAGMFAAAANTPLAMAVMAVELLGGGALPHVAIVCFAAYAMSGRSTIYPAQRPRHTPARDGSGLACS